MSDLWKVAVDAPIPQILTYRVPAQYVVSRGQRVVVPLGTRKVSGVALEHQKVFAEDFAVDKIREVTSVDDEAPVLSERFLKWLEWLSDYYIHSPGLTLALAYPPLKKTSTRKSTRAAVVPAQLEGGSAKPNLTSEQKKVLQDLENSEGFQAHLIFGVTGSGKTEIYLHALESILQKNQTGLVLVPEISLTPQLVDRFVQRFGEQVAVLHSQLTPREKTNQWWQIVSGEKKILIGARSALFCPIPNLGLIVVDEEHEASFKQDEKLKYQARDAAVMRARFEKCAILLGSATPSLETWQNALSGRYHLHTLKERVGQRPMPKIEVVDLRIIPSDDKRKVKLPSWLSEELHTQIVKTLGQNKQVAMFLNRRGFAPVLMCPSCGHSRKCPNCEISLTQHGKKDLICHYCDYHEPVPRSCPACHANELTAVGLGTEKVESDLQKLFPEHICIRADRDEIQTREELEDFVRKFENKEAHILIGTQMIAKGLDFPDLNLVGFVWADQSFHFPDFRAFERSFQLIVQMSGRSGRKTVDEERGLVLLQTHQPDHPILAPAIKQNFVEFAEQELQMRKSLRYPPFGKLVNIRFQCADLNIAEQAGALLKTRALQIREQWPSASQIDILGPAAAPMAKMRNFYRFQMLLKAPDSKIANQFTRALIGDGKWIPKGVKITPDVDPYHLL